MVSIPSRKAPSQWVAKALTSETKTQTKLAHIWTEGIFCPWRVNSLGQFFKAWKLFLFFSLFWQREKALYGTRAYGQPVIWTTSLKKLFVENRFVLHNRLSHVLGILHSQLICWEAQRMRGWNDENAGSGASSRSRQKTTFCLSLGAQGCHGNGFNYALSFIAEIFHWETIKKHFQTWFLKFWKRS